VGVDPLSDVFVALERLNKATRVFDRDGGKLNIVALVKAIGAALCVAVWTSVG
jgi:hypothetical protein